MSGPEPSEREKEATNNDYLEKYDNPKFREGTDFSTVDNDDIKPPETRLKELDAFDGAKAPATVILEDFRSVTYEDALGSMRSANDDIAPNYTNVWRDIASRIISAVGDFKTGLGGLEDLDDGWRGETHDAAVANVTTSLTQPDFAAKGANAMSILVDAFSRTINSTKRYLVDNEKDYNDSLARWPKHADEIKQGFNSFAQHLMTTVYAPAIKDIAAKNPGFTDGNMPKVGPIPGGPTNAGGPTGGPSGGPSGTMSPGGMGKPSMPSMPEIPKPPVPETPAPTMPTPTAPGLGKGPADAAQGITDAAKSAIGQATDAATKAAEAGKPQPGPPEGVLGLGPNGLNGASNKAAGAGGRGGGSGGGAGAGKPSLARPAGAPVMAASKLPEAAANASRAGMSSGAGAPGAGAPAAGHRGGGDGKEHKANKALRTKKNGRVVAGEAEAVVPVVGDEAQEAEAAKQSAPS